MPRCWHCKAETPAEHFDRTVHNKQELSGQWSGWRMAGRDLVSPEGDRFSPERLRGLAWRVASEERVQNARRRHEGRRQLVKVVVVDLDDYRSGGLAAS